MSKDSDKIITLKSFTFPHEAHLAKAKLESCNIPSFIQDQHLVGMNLWYSHAIGGVKLQVYDSDYDLAQEILNDNTNNIIEDQNIESDHCPKCKCLDVGYYKERNWKKRGLLSFLTFFLLGLPWIFPSKYYQCKSCGHIWKY